MARVGSQWGGVVVVGGVEGGPPRGGCVVGLVVDDGGGLLVVGWGVAGCGGAAEATSKSGCCVWGGLCGVSYAAGERLTQKYIPHCACTTWP